jgi:hypothetical protein
MNGPAIYQMIPTNFDHRAERGACGEWITSPHPDCQARHEPYHAGELLNLRHAWLIVCNACGAAWRLARVN